MNDDDENFVVEISKVGIFQMAVSFYLCETH